MSQRHQACASSIESGYSHWLNTSLFGPAPIAAKRPKPRVLVVEDEALLVLLIEDMIIETGSEMVGVAGTLHDAIKLAHTAEADVALLDLNLKGELSYRAAEVLEYRGVPLVFMSGYGLRALSERFRNCPFLDKPFDEHSLERAINAALRLTTGQQTTAQPFGRLLS